MTRSREQSRPPAATKRRGRKPILIAGLTGTFGSVRTRKKMAKGSQEEPSKLVEERLINDMLRGLFRVAKDAKEARRPLLYTVKVAPNGYVYPVEPPEPQDVLKQELARARERGQVKIAEILKGDDMLTASDFGQLIGASHETVNVKRGKGEVLGLQGATRAVRYPRWQVTEAGLPLPGLSRVFEILGKQPWTVYRFLQTEHSELGGRTALAALKAGQQEAVFAAADNQTNGVFS